MPKDYRERRIDIEPPRIRALQPKRATTAIDPEEPLPAGTYSTIVTLEPGDGVLWFLRLADADTEPGARMVSIVDTLGAAVSHTYIANDSALSPWYTYYIDTTWGNVVFNGDGDVVLSDTIYVIFDQFDGFTPGDYRLKWDVPGTARAHVEGAILLHGVDMTAQGTYYYYLDQSPEWSVTHAVGSDTDNFPISVPTANHGLVYGLWGMVGSVSALGGYNSVPGVDHLSYTSDDPTEPPVITTTIVSRLGLATGSSMSVAAPSENGNGGMFTTYYMNGLVFSPAAAADIVYTTITFEA